MNKNYFPNTFYQDCLNTAFLALADENLSIGDVVISDVVINKMHNYDTVVNRLFCDVRLDQRQKILVLKRIAKHILETKHKSTFYSSILHCVDLYTLDFMIKNDEMFLKEVCKNANTSVLYRSITSLSINSRFKGFTMDEESSIVSNSCARYLLKHNMKRLTKCYSGTKISHLYISSPYPELFSISALKKIPASRWGVVIKKDYKKWIHCPNITKISPLEAYSLIRKDPSVLLKHSDLREWKLSGSLWKKLIKNNQEVIKYMPKDYETTIMYLVLKRS